MGVFGPIIDGLNQVSQALGGSSGPQDFEKDGFIVSGIPSGDGNGLPSAKAPSDRRPAKQKRKIISWFVPEYGVVKMYVNPKSIVYSYTKIIKEEQTKGGFVIQYWGEELPKLTIAGTTGSSGIEGINVLYEIFRAEQLSFDAIGLALSADARTSGFQGIVDKAGESIFGGGLGGSIASTVAGGLLGADPGSGAIAPQNVPSLAALALGVEMYYDGSVFRGYFKDFTVTEDAESIGTISYSMHFHVTQRRGYRLNSMPWNRSAVGGPSNNSAGGIPSTFGHYSTKR